MSLMSYTPPCSIFHVKSYFFWRSPSVFSPPYFPMFYIRTVPLTTRNYKLPTKNGSNRHSNHPLWQQDGLRSDTHTSVNGTDLRNPFTTYFCLPQCSLLFWVFCLSLFYLNPPLFLSLFLHSLKMPTKKKKRNQEKWHRQWKSDGLYLKWTGTGLCHSTHVWSFSTFHSSSDTTVIILPWLETFVVCACCGWCAVTPNEDLQEKKKDMKVNI